MFLFTIRYFNNLELKKKIFFFIVLTSLISGVLPKNYITLFGQQVFISLPYLLILFLLIVLISYYFFPRKIILKKEESIDKLINFIIIWWIIVFFSTTINILIYTGPDLYLFENILNFIKWSSGLAFFLIGLKFINWDEKDLEIIIKLLIFTVLIISIFILFDYKLFYFYYELSGNISWSFWEGMAKHEIPEILGMISLMVLSLIFIKLSIIKKIIYLILFILIFIDMLFFFSRETYITIFIGILTLIIIKDISLIKKIILIFFYLFLLLVFLKLKFGQFVIWTINEINIDPNRASSFRFDRWISALKIGLDHPFVGVGFWGFKNFVPHGGGTSAHNAYLQAFVVGGVPGFFIFIIIIAKVIALIKSCIKASNGFNKAICEGMLSVLIGYLASAFFSDHFFTFYYFNIIFWGVTAILIVSIKKHQNVSYANG